MTANSACGTIVNDRRIGGNRTGGRVELRDRDVIVLGGATSPFVFTFVTEPRVSDAMPVTTGSRAAEPQQPGSPEVILVVDDNEAVLRFMRRTLEQQGYRVLAARDDTEASTMSKHHAGPLHVLLADIVMPRLSGYVLAERLRAQRPGLHVVFVTGHADISGAVNEDRYGGREPFLVKPFTGEQLVQTVRAALNPTV